ncbi:MAG: hypothetical protein NC204_00350 [Candidatus Amulumruptor caecigallinarius]|nr:hypothetical protein [Candidatus Amulumruptor caecigallinarius]
MAKRSTQKTQVLLLYVTTLIGVVLGVVSSIINTRFVDPLVYGDVRYVQNILNFTASLLLLGYFTSGSRLLAVARTAEDVARVKGCMVIVLLITVAVQLVVCVACGFFNIEKDNVSYLFWISLPVCVCPLFLNYVNTTAQGDNQIGRLAAARLLPAFIYVPMAYFVYSRFGADATKMILLQWGISAIVIGGVIVSTRPRFDNLRDTWRKLRIENKTYGNQLYIGSLVMVATNYIAGISLGVFNENNIEVGFYTLALTITGPLATLPAIIGTVYFKKFADQPRIPANVMKATALLTITSCIVFVVIVKPFVAFLYTDTYERVGTYATILSIGFSMHGFGDMINRYLGSHGCGKSIRNASIANGVFKVVGFTLFVYLFNIYGALLTMVFCSGIYLAILLYYYRRFISKNLRGDGSSEYFL